MKYTKKEIQDQSISPDRNLIVTSKMMKQLLEHMPDDPEPEFFEGQMVKCINRGSDTKLPSEYYLRYNEETADLYDTVEPIPDIAQWRKIPDDLMEMPSWINIYESAFVGFKCNRHAADEWSRGEARDLSWGYSISHRERITHVMRIPPCQ